MRPGLEEGPEGETLLDSESGVDCQWEGEGEAEEEGGERDGVGPGQVGEAVDAGEEGVG